MQKLLLLITVFLSSNFLFSQADSEHNHASNTWCGTEISPEWMEAFYQRDKSHLNNQQKNLDRKEIPIIYHVVGTDAGTGYFSNNDLLRIHCDFQRELGNANLHFWIRNINYINSTAYYNGQNTNQLFNAYNDLNALNVYIVAQMDGVCGYSYVPSAPSTGFGFPGPNRGGIMLAANCLGLGSTTYTHEGGHYFNLPHTFFGWENADAPVIGSPAPATIGWGFQTERVDGSNCQTSGDGFCDTPPDFIATRWQCNQQTSQSNAEYLDSQGVPFRVDGKNFMSYSNDACTEYFSEDQLAEMNNTPSTHRSYLMNNVAPDMSPLEAPTSYFPDNLNNISSSIDLKLKWNKSDRATAYIVQVTNNNNFFFPLFNEVVTDTFFTLPSLQVNRNYEYRVRPYSDAYPCSDFERKLSFTTSSLTANVEVVNESCAGARDGSVQAVQNITGQLQYRWTTEDPFLNSIISQQNTPNLQDLPAGEYTLRIVRNLNDTVTVPFTITSPPEIFIDASQNGSVLEADITGGTPPYTIIWDNGDTEPISENPLQGENSILLVDATGCQKSATVVFDSLKVGINQAEILSMINIYPNPTNQSFINIEFESDKNQDVIVEVFDMQGKKIALRNSNIAQGRESLQVDISNAVTGVYIVNIIIDNKMASKRVLVNR